MAELDNNNPNRIAGRLANRRTPADILQPVDQQASRSQAGAGTLGAQTGDFSGTGLGTSARTNPVTTQTGGDNTPRGRSSASESINERAMGFLDNLDRQARLGRISVRSASNIAARVLGDLGQQESQRFNTRAGAATSDLDRFGRASEGGLNRRSDRQNLLSSLASDEGIATTRIEAAAQEGALDRSSREQISGLDRQARVALGLEGIDVDRDRLAETSANNRSTQERLERQLGLESQRVDLAERQFTEGVRQFGVEQDTAQTAAQRQSLADQAEFKLQTVNDIAQLLDRQRVSLPDDVRAQLGDLLNRAFSGPDQQ